MAAVEAVFVAATETFAEVVTVLRQIDIVTAITEGRVLIGVRVLITETPSIFPVRLSGAKAFFITVPYSLPQHVRAVSIHLIVPATAIVAVLDRRIRIAPALKSKLILPQTLVIALLVA